MSALRQIKVASAMIPALLLAIVIAPDTVAAKGKRVRGDLHVDGYVGIGTTNPIHSLDVQGTIAAFGTGLNGDELQRFVLFADTNNACLFEAPNKDGNRLAYRFNWRGGGPDAMTISGDGYVGIGTASPVFPLDVQGAIAVFGTGLNGDVLQRFALYADVNNECLFEAPNKDGNRLAYRFNWRGGGPDAMTILPNGTTRVQVLQITGGADLAEHLNVTDSKLSDEFNIAPGMVVSIDPTGNRKFKLADEPYDRKRVGIISGGNGVKSGLVLRQEGNPEADGDQPVALTGQVWCYADASFGAIEPGDLLTTSSTPGHAMKVADFDRARFAVLGQALTGLKEGRGWVQVLVGKQ